MTTIPITRNQSVRKGWYRAIFDDCDCRLLVPIQWTGHRTFADLLSWPATTMWSKLTYVPAPRPDRQQRIQL